uniref:YD repeat-containing protein n=1 Tax=Candidatus Kentrum sp. LFY TaxID=2126342 RepID=A0A450U6S1_9GAMM|nr:MAG: hypothetical protein BECKLFY1418A_GA0070994_100170 [Candidatus Kentron sp. LFY]
MATFSSEESKIRPSGCGLAFSLAYDANGRIIQLLDWADRLRTYDYDIIGDLLIA